MKLFRVCLLFFPLMFASAQVTLGQDDDIGKQLSKVAGDNAVNPSIISRRFFRGWVRT
jgi:hypothetical protein